MKKKTESKAPVATAAEAKEVKVIERIIENKEIAPADAFGKLTRPQIELIKRTIAKDASDDELKMFIQVCKGANLNPFLKQVHLVPRWDTKQGIEVRAIQVSIDGFRSIAESGGQYAGNDDAVFEGTKEIEYGDKDTKKVTVPEMAHVTVYKVIQGQRYPFSATARWSEYYPGPKVGFQWHIRPYLMLGKCAEALALRKAFPKLLSGMYTEGEFDKGSEAQVEQKKQIARAGTLREQIATATAEEADKLSAMAAKSDKYTPEQKKEIARLVEERKVYLKESKTDVPAA